MESTESSVWLYLDSLVEHQQRETAPAGSDMIYATGGLLDALLDLATENDNLQARLAEFER